MQEARPIRTGGMNCAPVRACVGTVSETVVTDSITRVLHKRSVGYGSLPTFAR